MSKGITTAVPSIQNVKSEKSDKKEVTEMFAEKLRLREKRQLPKSFDESAKIDNKFTKKQNNEALLPKGWRKYKKICNRLVYEKLPKICVHE